MTLISPVSVSNPTISATIFRTSHGERTSRRNSHYFPFPCKNPQLFTNPKFQLSSVRTRAKPKDLILGNPSVSVEKGKYSYEVEALINKLSSLPPRGSIARCLEIFKNKLSLNDFVLIFKEFAQRGDWQRSLRLFKYMQRQIWCKPNEHIYTILIGLLGRESLLDKCAEIFDEMPSNGVARSVFSYTSLINAYGRNGQYQTSLEFLDRMKEERISPSSLTYNTIINSCVRGGLDWEGLLGLFAQMKHDGIQPDIITYNALLIACAKRGLGEEAEMVFRSMNEAGIAPDISTHAYLVETFGGLGRLEKVSELLKEMEMEGNMPDATSYNVLIEAYAESDSVKEAIGVLRQMQAAGCTPNTLTYSIVLSLYGRLGKYDEVRELFLEMKTSGIEPDASIYNILIEVFGEGGYFKEAVSLFHEMVEDNVEPNMETYEGLIFACGKGGLHEDTRKILLHMNKNRVVPSSKVFTGVIEAYGQAALYEEARVAINTMREVGSMPTIDTYNSLLRTFGAGGLYKECEEILQRMGELGADRDTSSINGMIVGYKQGGQYEESLKVYVEIPKARCVPDEWTLEAILSVYCSSGLVAESKKQFQEIKASGVMPSVICYCLLLSVYAKTGRWDDIYDLLNEMITNNISNTHEVIGRMLKGEYDDDSNWQMVEYVFDKYTSEGCGVGLRFYNSLLEALWWLGQKARAGRVLHEATTRGLYPELFRKSSLVWSVDVHRMSVGGALTATSVWLNNVLDMFTSKEDLPNIVSVVTVRGEMEKSAMAREVPVAKAVYTYVNDNASSAFSFPGWNKGRLTCHRPQLKRFLLGFTQSLDMSTDKKLVTLSNSTFPPPRSKSFDENPDGDNHVTQSLVTGRRRTKLMATTV